jgi:hypothetical protein
MENKKICILSFSPIAIDRRVLREIKAASDQFAITVIGYGNWQPPDYVNYIELKKNKRNFLFLLQYGFFLILGRFHPSFYEHAYWIKKEYFSALRFILEGDFDIIHANDWDSLPVAAKAKKNNSPKILFDAHEYSPEQEANNLFWRLLIKPFRIYLLEKYLPQTDEMVTVSDKIGHLYKQNFNILAPSVYNAPEYVDLNPTEPRNSAIHLIHHGQAIPGRFLEQIIQVMRYTDDRYFLNLMLVPSANPNYFSKLQRIANQISPNRVIFLEPVPPSEIVQRINKFDIGIPFLKVPQINIYYALPNKFFDFIMARLAVVIPPLPAMAEIINQYEMGKVSKTQSPKSMALLLNSLTIKEIRRYKRNSSKAAMKLNAQNEMRKLSRIYMNLT